MLVHYLNIDKAKGKTEDPWTSADPEMARRPGFTVTSGGVHGMQVYYAAAARSVRSSLLIHPLCRTMTGCQIARSCMRAGAMALILAAAKF